MAAKYFALAAILVLCCSLMADAQTTLPTPAPPGPQPWNGPIWKAKVNNMFKLFDLNKNLVHDLNDIQLMAAGYKGLLKVVVAADVFVLFAKMYPCAVLDINLPSLSISPLNSTVLQKCLADLGQAGAAAQITALCALFFPIFNINPIDLVMEQAEYTFFFSNLQLDAGVIAAAWPLFNPVNGAITLAQFTYPWAWHFFYTSSPTDPFNQLLGPLVNFN
jgi:hypothetical protein